MAVWTDVQLADLAVMTPREFEAKYPGEHTVSAIHVMRGKLRKTGIKVKPAATGRPASTPSLVLPDLPDAPSEDELWSAYDAMHEYLERSSASKSLLEADIAVETDRPFGVVFMSDFHLNSQGTDTKALRQDIELINGCEALRAYVGGDGIDNFILPALAHVHRDNAVGPLSIQFELFRSIIRQLLPSLLAVGTGNHDLWTRKLAGIDANMVALQDVPVLHTREDTYITLTVGQQPYVIYRKHRPPVNSRTNDGHGVQFMFRHGDRPFDVGVMEHHHQAHIGSFWGHGEMRWAIRTGSYKIHDSHAREWGYQHGGIGTPVLVFMPYRKQIIPFMSIPDAIDFLEA